MPEPEEHDRSLTEPDLRPRERWQRDLRFDHNDWAYAPLETVRENLLSTGYPGDRVHLVKGPVQETIPAQSPGSIASCRWTPIGTARPGTSASTSTRSWCPAGF